MNSEAGNGESNLKKKKKKPIQVPHSQLGFKPTFVPEQDLSNMRRRAYRPKAQRLANNPKNFRSQFVFTVHSSVFRECAYEDFLAGKDDEWDKVSKVTIKNRQPIHCCICREDKFTAGQATKCGHIFCWHCILMHNQKSLKALNCPVCNDYYTVEDLRTCQVVVQQMPTANQTIRLTLRVRNPSYSTIYNARQSMQDLQISPILRVNQKAIIGIFKAEKEQLENRAKQQIDQEVRKWIVMALTLSELKIQKAEGVQMLRSVKQKQAQQDGRYRWLLKPSLNTKNIHFYQQSAGIRVYLHPLCEKCIREQYGDNLPMEINEKIIEIEQTQYNKLSATIFTSINHVPLNTQIAVVLIQLKNIVNEQLNLAYEKEVTEYLERKRLRKQRQQQRAQHLRLKYEQNQEYMRKLKKMQYDQHYDIQLPDFIDPQLMKDLQVFPSLINAQTTQPPSETPQPQSLNTNFASDSLCNSHQHQTTTHQLLDRQEPKQSLKNDDFPTLFNPVAIAKQNEKPENGGGKKRSDDGPTRDIQPQEGLPSSLAKGESRKSGGKGKKKLKFVNMTHEFFSPQLQDAQD